MAAGPLLGYILVLSPACLGLAAKTPMAMPGLAVPTPPTRTVVPVTLEEPAPPPAPAPASPPARVADPPATRTSPPVSAPPTSPPAAPVIETPPPVLQTAANVAGLETKVKNTLNDAEQVLAKVNSPALSREAKDQYNTAWSHVRQAREAIGYQNLVYAQQLADKALALAKQLVKG